MLLSPLGHAHGKLREALKMLGGSVLHCLRHTSEI